MISRSSSSSSSTTTSSSSSSRRSSSSSSSHGGSAAVGFQRFMYLMFFRTLGLWILACINVLRKMSVYYVFAYWISDPQLEVLRIKIARTDRMANLRTAGFRTRSGSYVQGVKSSSTGNSRIFREIHRVWLKQNLNCKGWDSHVRGEFPRKLWVSESQ